MPVLKNFCVLERHENIHSHYLLEASAGTGKTFTIENLVVRFLLEEPRLSIKDILLVTFTRAATKELRQRIFENIYKALEILQNQDRQKAFDFLLPWMEDEKKTKQAKRLLEDALALFDEAQIFTIHSFCEKMLKEYGSDLEMHFSQGQVSTKTLLQIIHNYYRTGVDDEVFSSAQLEIILKACKSNLEELDRLLLEMAKRTTPLEPQPSCLQLFEETQHLVTTSNSLEGDKDDLKEIFLSYLSQFKKTGFVIPQEELESSAEEIVEAMIARKIDQKTFERWIKKGLPILEMMAPDNAKQRKKEMDPHPLHFFIEFWRAKILPIIQRARDPWRILAAMGHGLQETVRRFLQEEEQFRFDDLLEAMEKAVSSSSFVEKVRSLYKAVIIDEFQDTDRLQWRIFKTLFHHDQGYLYLVGDPKQSIYAFRQADIYTYLAASQVLGEGCQATLQTNYRSTSFLVEAVNAFFSQSPTLISLPSIQSSLPFHPVLSGTSHLPLDDEQKESLHCWVLERDKNRSKTWPTTQIEEEDLFPTISNEILRLHDFFGVDWQAWAILVKDRYQGKRLFDFLQEQGIPVCAQREEKLTDSKALPILQELMQAVMHPKNESCIKISLASLLFDFSLEEIDLEEAFEKFLRWRKLFYDEGISFMFADLLSSTWEKHPMTVAENLLHQHEGENILRDLQQMVDLLSHEENASRATPQQVMRTLENFRDLELVDEESIKIRQDPKKGAVNILTMHMSKGLEFDYVVYLAASSRTKREERFIPVANEDGVVMLTPYEDHQALPYHHEIDAEKIRQLYVGMTRAKYRLYLPVLLQRDLKQDLQEGLASPLEIYFKKVVNGVLTEEKVLNLLSSMPHVSVSPCDSIALQARDEEKAVLSPPQKIHLSIEGKYASSFSALSKHQPSLLYSGASPQNFNAEEKTSHTLPSGAKTGLILHQLMENLPWKLVKNAVDDEDLLPFVRGQLQHTPYASWDRVFAQMIFKTLGASLAPQGFSLRDVDEKEMFREIEFFFKSENYLHVDYLKGVIDLVFMYRGLYYIVDWKSNWLGQDEHAYHQSSLMEAMKTHQYHLQASIYKEALRRYLHIVDHRSFNECFGGVYYFFMRGIGERADYGILLADEVLAHAQF